MRKYIKITSNSNDCKKHAILNLKLNHEKYNYFEFPNFASSFYLIMS